MYECTTARKFDKVWCVLVDQHFLVYSSRLDKYPKWVLYLHHRNLLVTTVSGAAFMKWVVSNVRVFYALFRYVLPPQTDVTLCITMNDPCKTPDLLEVRNKKYYRLDSAEEAKDWKELLLVLAMNSVGTCMWAFT